LENKVKYFLSKLNFADLSIFIGSLCSDDSSKTTNKTSLFKLIEEIESLFTDDVTDHVTNEVGTEQSPSLFGPGLKTVPGGDDYK
jgi:hypothetical protein